MPSVRAGEADLKSALEDRKSIGLLRSTPETTDAIDFASNDYLGFCQDRTLRKAILDRIDKLKFGGCASRLISGNSILYTSLEKSCAEFFGAQAALIFNSGYVANIGLLSSLPLRTDTILYDAQSHASIRDGARISLAQAFSFRHNDLGDLEAKLRRTKGSCYVVIEALYSMAGDLAPLKEICKLCQHYSARLIVDEAHSTGTIGEHGRGLTCSLELEECVFARICTFGKALASQGAVVLGSAALREYLVNFARSFIYTTALPETSLFATICALQHLRKDASNLTTLSGLIAKYLNHAQESRRPFSKNTGPIQYLLVSGNDHATKLAQAASDSGFHVAAIRSPTVPTGSERLRISLHSFNTAKHLRELMSALEQNYHE
ncbi:MAG: 8-amino-7-oxononanoate synthase [Bdellovibrionales bacterium]|nr:8-amino-7-oxononanoate synthase [Bdellovibrionales bacterium]